MFLSKFFCLTTVSAVMLGPAFAQEALSCYDKKNKQIDYVVKAPDKKVPVIFYSFTDLGNLKDRSGDIVEAYFELDGKRFKCELWDNDAVANCGKWTLQDELKTGWGTSPAPNYPYPYRIAFDGSNSNKAYFLADAYVFNRRFPNPNKTFRTPKAPPLTRCISTAQLKADPSWRFQSLYEFHIGQGRNICIESIECTANASVTTLSSHFYMIETKYAATLNSLFAPRQVTTPWGMQGTGSGAADNAEAYQQVLSQIEPLLSSPDVKIGVFTIKISNAYVPYKSVL